MAQLKDNHFHTCRTISDMLDISPSTVFLYLTESLALKPCHLRWVPHGATRQRLIGFVSRRGSGPFILDRKGGNWRIRCNRWRNSIFSDAIDILITESWENRRLTANEMFRFFTRERGGLTVRTSQGDNTFIRGWHIYNTNLTAVQRPFPVGKT
jgi:hypothetical protein